MYTSRRSHDPQPYRRRKFLRWVNRQLQFRYASGLMGAVLTLCLILAGPLLYFTRQNYLIFYELAYENAPEMLQHLEREITFLTAYTVAIVCAALISSFILGIRITARFASPVSVVERHIRKLAKGQLFLRELKVRQSDEFPELIRSYNYLCASLKSNAQAEIDLLRDLPLDPNDLSVSNKVRSLIETKDNQIHRNVS